MIKKSIPEQGAGDNFSVTNQSIQVSAHQLRHIKLGTKHEAAAILGISPETLKRYRLQKNSPLIPGIHYFVWNSRTIRYNLDLIADWGLHRNDPIAHQQAIEQFLASLPVNQSKKRGRGVK